MSENFDGTNLNSKNVFEKYVFHKYAILLYCAVISFLLLLICSRSSFLYPYNDWDDANSYFSMGKAIFNGKIPYRDVFDQKGFYLYFLYGLAYLISHTTFIGVFLLEIVLSTYLLYGAYRILLLYVNERTACILLPLFGAVVFSSYSFYKGGSAEEICLPFYMWGLYLSLRYFKEQYPEPMKSSTVFTGGVLAGTIAMIKFTGLGFFFAWMMMVAFSFLLRRDWVGMIKNCLIFLGGMLLTFLPVIVYFAVNGALYDMYWGYIYINVFVYSDLNEEGPSLWERVYTLSKLLYWTMLKNIQYFAFTILGVLKILLTWKTKPEMNLKNDFKKKQEFKWLEKVNLIFLCFFLFLGIYIGGSELPYYALPLCIFSILGFAAIGVINSLLCSRFRNTGGNSVVSMRIKNAGSNLSASGITHEAGLRPAVLFSVFSIVISLLFVYHFSMNTYFMHTEKEDHFLYQFQSVVAETPDPTLLNIGCLDAGLYTVCDIVPTCQWFQTQTLRISDVDDAQKQYIAEGRTDYVIAREVYPDVIWETYELAAQVPYERDGLNFTWYLFRKK